MKLTHLTDKTVLKDTLILVAREREILSQVLWHLREIDRRKLYSDLKCESLFAYCVKVLKYSESQAGRRVSAMRLLKDLPEISQSIEKGDLNLTQLMQAKQLFADEGISSKEEKIEIIDKIKGKTTRESEKILWEIRKEEPPKKVTITLKEETHTALKKLQALKAHACPDLDTLIMKMCKELSQAWDPTIVKRRHAQENESSRFVSKTVVAHVWERDKSRCVNCGSTYALELDHIHAFALGGKTTAENLRLLCRNCNQRKGMKEFPKNSGNVLGSR